MQQDLEDHFPPELKHLPEKLQDIIAKSRSFYTITPGFQKNIYDKFYSLTKELIECADESIKRLYGDDLNWAKILEVCEVYNNILSYEEEFLENYKDLLRDKDFPSSWELHSLFKEIIQPNHFRNKAEKIIPKEVFDYINKTSKKILIYPKPRDLTKNEIEILERLETKRGWRQFFCSFSERTFYTDVLKPMENNEEMPEIKWSQGEFQINGRSLSHMFFDWVREMTIVISDGKSYFHCFSERKYSKKYLREFWACDCKECFNCLENGNYSDSD